MTTKTRTLLKVCNKQKTWQQKEENSVKGV
jgi:hypothetical protein